MSRSSAVKCAVRWSFVREDWLDTFALLLIGVAFSPEADRAVAAAVAATAATADAAITDATADGLDLLVLESDFREAMTLELPWAIFSLILLKLRRGAETPPPATDSATREARLILDPVDGTDPYRLDVALRTNSEEAECRLLLRSREGVEVDPEVPGSGFLLTIWWRERRMFVQVLIEEKGKRGKVRWRDVTEKSGAARVNPHCVTSFTAQGNPEKNLLLQLLLSSPEKASPRNHYVTFSLHTHPYYLAVCLCDHKSGLVSESGMHYKNYTQSACLFIQITLSLPYSLLLSSQSAFYRLVLSFPACRTHHITRQTTLSHSWHGSRAATWWHAGHTA